MTLNWANSSFILYIMVATLSAYVLTWASYSQWAPKDDEIGGIYTNSLRFDAFDEYNFVVSFRIGEGRQLGLLFAEVVMIYPNRVDTSTQNYCLGQFYTNKGAKLFAQFALDHFVQTETWAVCPSFEPIDYIDGEPCTMGGDEIVSDLI